MRWSQQPLTIHFDDHRQHHITDFGHAAFHGCGSAWSLGKTMRAISALLFAGLVCGCSAQVAKHQSHDSDAWSVSGEVQRPGSLGFQSELDILKAVSLAGGFTEAADQTRVRIIHANGVVEVVDVRKIIDGEADDVPIRPGDEVRVRKR
jgi:hypothetical protein